MPTTDNTVSSSTANDKEQLVEMTFWDHLDAMRSVLLRAAIVVTVLSVGFFTVMPDLFDRVILAPCRGDFVLYRLFNSITRLSEWLPDFSTDDFHVELINIQLASQFFIHISTSFWLALVFSCPIILYLLWGFISPALYSTERRSVQAAFVAGNLDVLSRSSGGILHRVSRYVTLFSRISCKRERTQPNITRLLYGQLPYDDICHGTCV